MAVIMLCIGTFCLCPAADEGTPTVSIEKHTLTLKDSIWIVYFVDSANVPTGAECGVLVWDEPQESYTIDSTTTVAELTSVGKQEDGGVYYDRYNLTGVAARDMATDYYAVAYVKNGDEVTYSALDKYSVLQYAHTQISDSTITTKLRNLLESMLDYGAMAQIYFDHNLSRPANGTYYQITAEGGTLADGTTGGLYLEGDSITLTAPTANADGTAFSCWQNSAGEQASTSASYSTTVGKKDEKYTAVYGTTETEPEPDPEPEITAPTLVVGNVTAAAGATGVQVPITVVNNPGIAGATIEITYASGLTLKSATNGTALDAMDFSSSGVMSSPYKCSWDSMDGEIAQDGTIVILTFDIPATATAGDVYDISVSYRAGDVYNNNWDDVNFETVAGTITVS